MCKLKSCIVVLDVDFRKGWSVRAASIGLHDDHLFKHTTTSSTTSMNIPAILSLFRVARDPSLCLPHATVSTFADLPIPLSRAFGRSSAGTSRTRFIDREKDSNSSTNESDEDVDIRAVVLDKDNCFAVPHTDEVFPAYSVCRLCICC